MNTNAALARSLVALWGSITSGIGATYETLRGSITQDIELLAAFDSASQQGPGGANNPHGLGGKSGKVSSEIIDTVDNVNDDKDAKPARPTDNSAQQGLRRIDKAAAEGDEAAKEALDQVKAGNLSVHKACILLSFRKGPPTPLEVLKREWRATEAVLIGSSARLCASITASNVSSGIAASCWYRAD